MAPDNTFPLLAAPALLVQLEQSLPELSRLCSLFITASVTTGLTGLGVNGETPGQEDETTSVCLQTTGLPEGGPTGLPY